MSDKYRFDELSIENQDRARAGFLDAREGDGYWYRLNIDGVLLCRNKINPMSDKAVNQAPFSLIGKQGTAIWQGNEIVCQMSDARTNHREARERAEMFVLAANNHYKLVEALEEILDSGFLCGSTELHDRLRDKARQVLAEVKS